MDPDWLTDLLKNRSEEVQFEKICLPETLFLEIMTPEQILSHPPKVLSQEQRQDYFDLGYVKVEGLIPKTLWSNFEG